MTVGTGGREAPRPRGSDRCKKERCDLPLASLASVRLSRAAEALFSGTYRQVSALTGRVLATGNELVIASGPEPHRFSLNAIRPSDSNVGYVGGTLAHADGPQTWTSTQLAGGNLKVTQDLRFGDCGFGYGVIASGTYARTRTTGKLGSWNGP